MADIYKKLTKDFKELSESDVLFHAYLFFGESTDNIFDFSRTLAGFLETGEFKAVGRFLNDLVIIKPNEHNNIGIDEVREMQNFLYQSPVASKRRMVIIYNAGALTDEAQSGILKIIEEPPKKSLIILIATGEDVVLETLKSRMHKIYFSEQGVDFKKADKKSNKLINKDDVDVFIKKTLVDLTKNLRQNSGTIKEVLRRLAMMKQFNLNNRLQLRLLNYYLDKRPKK